MMNKQQNGQGGLEPILATEASGQTNFEIAVTRAQMTSRWQSLLAEPCQQGWNRRSWMNQQVDLMDNLLSLIG